MTFKLSVDPGGFVEVEYFGTTTFADRANGLDSLSDVPELASSKRILVNFLGANVVGSDDSSGRLDFVAKAVTHHALDGCKVALVGLSHADAHPAETAGIIRLLRVRSFHHREEAIQWLLGN